MQVGLGVDMGVAPLVLKYSKCTSNTIRRMKQFRVYSENNTLAPLKVAPLKVAIFKSRGPHGAPEGEKLGGTEMSEITFLPAIPKASKP